jgi:anti-sigma regulatory factor (Ser/Thr protein kinase)
MKRFNREYTSNYSSVSRARRDVGAFARKCGLPLDDVYDVTLAAGEACNNAAEHGHVAGGVFTVNCWFNGSEIVVEIADRGEGFDPVGKGEAQDPTVMRLRGLGIFIMRSLMDEVVFSVDSSGTSVRMTKHLKTDASTKSDTPTYEGHSSPMVLRAAHDRPKSLFELVGAHAGGHCQS